MICLWVRVQKSSRISNGSVCITALKGKGSWQSENKECLELGRERCPNRTLVKLCSGAGWFPQQRYSPSYGQGFPDASVSSAPAREDFPQWGCHSFALLCSGEMLQLCSCSALLCSTLEKCYSSAQLPWSVTILLQQRKVSLPKLLQFFCAPVPLWWELLQLYSALVKVVTSQHHSAPSKESNYNKPHSRNLLGGRIQAVAASACVGKGQPQTKQVQG